VTTVRRDAAFDSRRGLAMSIHRQPEYRARADLRVLVSRNGRGDLHDGIDHRLRRIDGVLEVEEVDVSGLRPGLNDLAVDLVATLRLRPERPDADSAALAEQLRAGFGVQRAEVRVLSREVRDV
jgi:translation elongation factor EF-1beta